MAAAQVVSQCAVITSTYLSWMLYAYVLDKIFVFFTVVYDVL